LGYTDKYMWGWLSVVINLSDLAASGAKPIALLNSLQLPPDMRLSELYRLLDGVDDAASSNGTSVIGGNIEEASRLDISVTAIGLSYPHVLSRVGGKEGDRLIAVGPLGEFWSQFLDARDGALDQPRAVLYPVPQLKAGKVLVEDKAVHACVDNSDGLAVAVELLAHSSDCGAMLNSEAFKFTDEVVESAARRGVTPLHFALGWGDWNLVCAVASVSVDRVLAKLAESEVRACEIGCLVPGSDITLEIGHREIDIPSPQSERLTRDSWMSTGINSYIERLLSWSPMS
jgi:thiamine-monophosphate kinase